MLSPLRYRIDEKGSIVRTSPLPHVMFYAPNLTDEDIGGGRGMPVFINNVSPQGMMIVPVGEKEKAAILEESATLTTRVEQELGYTRPQ